ncbi:MAG: transglutaminase family protein [Verrucomicrobiota bacterium]
MAIHVALNHRTIYEYDRKINLGPQVIRLRPAPHCRTNILSYTQNISPSDHFLNWQQDPHGNYLGRLVFNEKTQKFEVDIELIAEMEVYNPFDFFLEDYAEKFPFEYDKSLQHDLLPYLAKLPKDQTGVDFETFLVSIDLPKTQRTIDFLVSLNLHIQSKLKYLIRMEPGVQTPLETLYKGSGSCRDFAWLLCQVLRHFGLASRFVSGYLIQLKQDEKSLDGPSGVEEDFTDLHAWTEVYLPGAGWIGLDSTSGLLAGEGHIPLACTPEPSSAAPIEGGLEKCEVTFSHHMSVTRIYEAPRSTKPYPDGVWEDIEALGYRVDAKLEKNKIPLTMGGEPTFVSIDNRDSEEWSTTALGAHKRERAVDLLYRLHKRFSPGGLLHFGQGKWYPGESLPRWAFGCYWRKDGTPIWDNIDLIAKEETDYGVQAKDSEIFMKALVSRLGLDPGHVLTGHEDAWYYMWKERRLPMNVDPLKSNLKEKEERDRLAKVFQEGLNTPVGHLLPIRRNYQMPAPHWESGAWFTRDENLYLIPGDSPMGFRLPLESLPWVKESDYPYIHEFDPLIEHPPLPKRPDKDRQAFIRSGIPELYREAKTPNFLKAATRKLPKKRKRDFQQLKQSKIDPSIQPELGESAPWVIRTGMAIEPRDGKLNVFMPPVECLEDYLELIAAIEETSEYLGMPVRIEGYPPPTDHRLNIIKVTPDPGVIEVNVHPGKDWSDLVDMTTGVYEDAKQARLTTEKFMMDGKHTGTGGGNHFVIGAEHPASSPFLQRPDLLRSLLNYWHNHPSLSYLFSGLFIGPTSQAPRVDEARNDAIYELDLAFKQIPDHTHIQPWVVDRIFRNLLTDVTGNTHRAEFCIDKLYSPDNTAGRLGLLELRSFEMPPHARMSLVQQLLLRSLISNFWEKPYSQPLVPWGTELHDRFMLPHFVWQDMQDVISDLQSWNLPFQESWFQPHYHFRFPVCGENSYREINMELRTALEPWHVLGEEGVAGGTARFVDSSVERVQVKTDGFIGSRYQLLCNGYRMPLQNTGTVGEYVAGVRYRAWQPPSCLHPTIPVQAPLIFDLYDNWTQKSLGGFTYHVSHPGGRSYDTFPVNAFEAESRRLSRYSHLGHTPGKFEPPHTLESKEFPFTLDLRHQHFANREQ